MIALDTNVIIDLDEGSPDLVERVVAALEAAGERQGLVVCGIVYAELCARPSRNAAEVAATLRAGHIAVETHLELEVWTGAGLAYAAYAQRRRASGGGRPRRIVADFIIGAHARTVGTLLTSDAEFYRRAFPDLRVVFVR